MSNSKKIVLASIISPMTVWAQTTTTIKSIANDLTGLLESLVPVLVGVGLLAFIFGLTEYIFQAGNKGAVETGRNRMITGIIGLFAIATIWGLVQLLGATLDLGITTTP